MTKPALFFFSTTVLLGVIFFVSNHRTDKENIVRVTDSQNGAASSDGGRTDKENRRVTDSRKSSWRDTWKDTGWPAKREPWTDRKTIVCSTDSSYGDPEPYESSECALSIYWHTTQDGWTLKSTTTRPDGRKVLHFEKPGTGEDISVKYWADK